MSIRELKNYNEWPRWSELAHVMASVLAFRIVQSNVWRHDWIEDISSVVGLRHDDLVDHAVKMKIADMKLASNPSSMTSIMGGMGSSVDLSDDSVLVMEVSYFISFLCDGKGVEPLPATSTGKAWSRIAGYLKESESFKALMTFMAEKYYGTGMKERLNRYGLLGSTNSSHYNTIQNEFQSAYPDAFRKGFWSSIFG